MELSILKRLPLTMDFWYTKGSGFETNSLFSDLPIMRLCAYSQITLEEYNSLELKPIADMFTKAYRDVSVSCQVDGYEMIDQQGIGGYFEKKSA
ncbi:hypothetical protein Tco_0952853 [Tanacetum coccineum]|uniref:Uncharacterized protein n=1 Tax=Tanacetum coccineum TaxID=301880 RepID=A0ABQ5DYP4_9ASTR